MQGETNGEGIDDLDFVEGSNIAFTLRTGQVDMSLQAEFSGLGVEIRAIVEFDALAQGDRQGLPIGGTSCRLAASCGTICKAGSIS